MSNENKTVETSDDEALRAKSRRKLLIIFAMFGLPLLGATIYLQMVRMSGGTLGNTANGELVSPAVPMEEFSVATLDGEAFDLDALRGRWTLMYLPTGECLEVCQQNLYHMRQVRLALNHRMNRVQRVLVVETPDQISPDLRQEYVGTEFLSDSIGAQEVLTQQISAAVAAMKPIDNVIYLFDPLGNLMMRFSPDTPPKKLLKDLKHLLKVSRIG